MARGVRGSKERVAEDAGAAEEESVAEDAGVKEAGVITHNSYGQSQGALGRRSRTRMGGKGSSGLERHASIRVLRVSHIACCIARYILHCFAHLCATCVAPCV